MNYPKLVFITWLDINNNTGPWVELPDDTAPSECFSFGWLVQENEVSVSISATFSDNDDEKRHAMLTSCIPKCCITRIETIDAENVLALWAK